MWCRIMLPVLTFLLLSLSNGAKAEERSQQKKVEELAEKIERLEKTIKHLEKAKSTVNSLKINSIEIKKIKKKLKKEGKKNRKRLASIKRIIDLDKERFSVNGFMSVAAVKGEGDLQYGGTAGEFYDYGKDISYDTLSNVGIQFNYKVADNVDAVVQTTAKGAGNWDLKTEWAYTKIQITDDLAFRAGRMRLPIYLFSESLEVSFTYPWIKPPASIYSPDLTSMNGMDINYRFGTGEWVHMVQIATGRVSVDEVSVKDQLSINVTSTIGAWTFRVGHNEGKAALETDLISIDSEKVTYSEIGGIYDDGRFLAIAELIRFDANAGPFPTFAGGYFTLGYRIGKFMPHVTLLTIRTTEDNEDPLANAAYFRTLLDPNGSGETNNITAQKAHKNITLGLRYELNSKTALKFEWRHLFGMQKSKSIDLDNPIADFSDPSGPEMYQPVAYGGGIKASQDNKLNIFAISIDTVF